MIDYTAQAGVATVTLASVANRNALSIGMLEALRDALDVAADDSDVRVVVLTATGTTFCSGADVRELATGSWNDGPTRYAGLLASVLDHPKPTIARVQGHVVGGGNGLVAACDFAVAVATATFAFSEVRLGAVPAVVSVPVLATISLRDAQELMLLAERVSAHRVLAAGLLTHVVDDESELDATVRRWVSALVAAGPQALRRTREVLRRVPQLDRERAFAWATEVAALALGSEEAAEGLTARRERRSPAWVPRSGRPDRPPSG